MDKYSCRVRGREKARQEVTAARNDDSIALNSSYLQTSGYQSSKQRRRRFPARYRWRHKKKEKQARFLFSASRKTCRGGGLSSVLVFRAGSREKPPKAALFGSTWLFASPSSPPKPVIPRALSAWNAPHFNRFKLQPRNPYNHDLLTPRSYSYFLRLDWFSYPVADNVRMKDLIPEITAENISYPIRRSF